MSDKKRLPKAPYPNVDDALADQTRPELVESGAMPPGTMPGEDADVRPHIDGRDSGKDTPATGNFPQTPLARDPALKRK